MEPYLTLKSGAKIPSIGLGTWQLRGPDCAVVVTDAIELGYTHIDTAIMYENHVDVAAGMKSEPRENLFVTSKIPHDQLAKKDFLAAAEKCFRELETDYLDLLLIHWPNSNIPMEEPLSALAELKQSGKIRDAGVSNFTISHLEEALKLDVVDISVNQVEFHPYLYQQELLQFCKERGIVLEAYSPLGRGEILGDRVLNTIANSRSATSAQVALAWLLSKGVVVLPKSGRYERLKENMQAEYLTLSADEIAEIDGLGKNERLVVAPWAEFDR